MVIMWLIMFIPITFEEHVKYNCKFRFGCALVIGGEIKNQGYLDEDRIKDIISKMDLSRYKSYSNIPYR